MWYYCYYENDVTLITNCCRTPLEILLWSALFVMTIGSLSFLFYFQCDFRHNQTNLEGYSSKTLYPLISVGMMYRVFQGNLGPRTSFSNRSKELLLLLLTSVFSRLVDCLTQFFLWSTSFEIHILKPFVHFLIVYFRTVTVFSPKTMESASPL